MDLSLTENQEMLRNSVREFIENEFTKETLVEMGKENRAFSDEVWSKASGLGWLGIIIPDRYGGEGRDLTDAGVLFQELGRGPIPGPFFTSGILGASIVMEAGRDDQKSEILPAIAQGRQILVPAITEEHYGWGPDNIHMTAERKNGSYVLNGSKLFVQDGSDASHLICPVRTESSADPSQGISLLVVDRHSPGISSRYVDGFIATSAVVDFDSVEVPESNLLGDAAGQGWDALSRAVQRSIPVLCAYKVGGCEAVFDMSVEYSRTPPPVRDSHRPVPESPGPHRPPGEPPGRVEVDNLRGALETGRGTGRHKQRPPGKGGFQRRFLPGLQLCA